MEFLLTPLREGRPFPLSAVLCRDRFLLTPLREGRRRPPRRHSPSGLFLLTPLREGRPGRFRFYRAPNSNFYSRPCGRGDFLFSVGYTKLSISTHAPAGGATTPDGAGGYITTWISTHAPAGGATRNAGRAAAGPPISTHAPAGGATKADASGKPAMTTISTHAPAGGATMSTSNTAGQKIFLLTPLREGRRGA